MKYNICIMLMFILPSLAMYAEEQEGDNSLPDNTRELKVNEFLIVDSIGAFFNSPAFNDFRQINFENIEGAYELNRQYVDSVISADSLSPNFFRVYGGRFVNTFRQAGDEGSKMALFLFLPWFAALLALVIIIYFISIYFVHKKLHTPDKLVNENIEDSYDEGQSTPDN